MREQEELLNDYYTPFIKSKLETNTKDYTKELKELNKKVIVLETKVESWKQRVNEIVDFIFERVKGLFGNILKIKYKDVANDLRENNIITEKEYNKINNEPIKKEYKGNKNKDDYEL